MNGLQRALGELAAMSAMYDLAVDDFKTENNCQKNLMEHSMLRSESKSSASQMFHPSMMITVTALRILLL